MNAVPANVLARRDEIRQLRAKTQAVVHINEHQLVNTPRVNGVADQAIFSRDRVHDLIDQVYRQKAHAFFISKSCLSSRSAFAKRGLRPALRYKVLEQALHQAALCQYWEDRLYALLNPRHLVKDEGVYGSNE